MDRKIREKQGLKLLAQHPGTKVLWVCADGTAFDCKPLADKYAAKIGKADILEVNATGKRQSKTAKPQPKVPRKGSKKGAKTE